VVQNNDDALVEGSGSSFATAVATGFGGLFIYCTLILDMSSTSSLRRARAVTGDKLDKLETVWDYNLMRCALANLSAELRGVGRKLTRPETMINNFLDKLTGNAPLPERDLTSKEAAALKDVLRGLKATCLQHCSSTLICFLQAKNAYDFGQK
jgi:hypothetical protein